MCRKRDIAEGTKDIINLFGRTDFFDKSKLYCYNSIDFEKNYGLYHTYDDLFVADVEWQPGKTNQQLRAEVKEELLEELIIWKKKINSGNV